MDGDDLTALFEPFAAVTIKGMFGGRGVYAHGLMFALQAGGEVYLKTDEVSEPRFAAAGSGPFIFPTPRGPKATSYWRLPAGAHDDPDELIVWAGLALEAARRAAAAKDAKGAGRARAKSASGRSEKPAGGAEPASVKRGRGTRPAGKRAAVRPGKGRARRGGR